MTSWLFAHLSAFMIIPLDQITAGLLFEALTRPQAELTCLDRERLYERPIRFIGSILRSTRVTYPGGLTPAP